MISILTGALSGAALFGLMMILNGPGAKVLGLTKPVVYSDVNRMKRYLDKCEEIGKPLSLDEFDELDSSN